MASYKPSDLFANICRDNSVEMGISVLESEGVGVRKVIGYLEKEFRRKLEEGGGRWEMLTA